MNKKWGNYKVLLSNKNYKIKILTLKPHSKTSLQKHNHRAEFWLLLDKKDKFTCRIIKQKEIHTLINDTNKVLKVLEVQFGDKCIESDIERFK